MAATKSQLQVLEDLINIWLDGGLTDIDIHKLVDLIINNHIVDGNFTPEYLRLAKLAIEQKNKPIITTTDVEKPQIIKLKKYN